MVGALMVDVDGVVVCGRPSGNPNWAADIEDDLGISVADLQREFFIPHWNDIVIGQADLIDRLSPVLARLAQGVGAEDFIDYWFSNDSRLDDMLLTELADYRQSGLRIYLATNQEHLRARYIMEMLGLGRYVDGIFYSAALGSKKPERAFFEKAQSRSGFEPSALLLIDDNAENVEAAKSAGWNALVWSGKEALSDLIEVGLKLGDSA